MTFWRTVKKASEAELKQQEEVLLPLPISLTDGRLGERGGGNTGSVELLSSTQETEHSFWGQYLKPSFTTAWLHDRGQTT